MRSIQSRPRARLLALLIVTAPLLAACGGSDTTTDEAASAAPTTSTAAATVTTRPADVPENDAYCLAWRDLIRAQPAGSFQDPLELSEAFDDYAAAIEGALDQFPAEQASVLAELAAANRTYAADTESDDALARLGELFAPMADVAQDVAVRCGVEFMNASVDTD